MACQSPFRVGVFVTCVVVLCFVFAINGLSGGRTDLGIFLNDTGSISSKYYLEITPAGWTFSIWGIIYIWQLLFIGYGLSTFCRKGIDGPLYLSPEIMPWQMYAIYTCTSILNISWLFLWDRQLLPAAAVVLACITFSLYLAIGASCVAVHKHLSLIYANGLIREVWLIRFMVQNALAFYAAWVTIATLLNLGNVLVYWGKGLDMRDTCTAMLVVLTLDILVYVILDWFVWDRYIRYIFGPYIVVIVALLGSMSKNYVPSARNSVFTVVLLGFACAAAVVKLVLMIYRHIKYPLINHVGPSEVENKRTAPDTDDAVPEKAGENEIEQLMVENKQQAGTSDGKEANFKQGNASESKEITTAEPEKEMDDYEDLKTITV